MILPWKTMLVPTNPWQSKMVCRRCSRMALPIEHEPVAGADLAAESDVLHAAEGDESLVDAGGPALQKKLESCAAASQISTPGISG